MITTITVIHVLVCIVLILVVLLQTGKGSEMGAVFGGSSQTVFGSTGAAPFLSKFTTGSAIVFMLTSLLLATLATGPAPSIMDDEASAPVAAPTLPPAVEPTAPAATEQAAPEAKATEPDIPIALPEATAKAPATAPAQEQPTATSAPAPATKEVPAATH